MQNDHGLGQHLESHGVYLRYSLHLENERAHLAQADHGVFVIGHGLGSDAEFGDTVLQGGSGVVDDAQELFFELWDFLVEVYYEGYGGAGEGPDESVRAGSRGDGGW